MIQFFPLKNIILIDDSDDPTIMTDIHILVEQDIAMLAVSGEKPILPAFLDEIFTVDNEHTDFANRGFFIGDDEHTASVGIIRLHTASVDLEHQIAAFRCAAGAHIDDFRLCIIWGGSPRPGSGRKLIVIDDPTIATANDSALCLFLFSQQAENQSRHCITMSSVERIQIIKKFLLIFRKRRRRSFHAHEVVQRHI